MSEYVDFIARYNAFVESTLLDEEAFLAGIGDFITDDSVFELPESIPGLGVLVGFAGWTQWRQTISRYATSLDPQYSMTTPQHLEGGDVVWRWYDMDYAPTAAFPDGFHLPLGVRYEFAGGKIGRLTEFWLDSTGFARYLGA